MQLDGYVDALSGHLVTAVSAGDEDALDLARRLTAALDAAVRLTLLDALSTAAAEITSELAPGSVDVRLRGGEPEFVIAPPPASTAGGGDDRPGVTGSWTPASPSPPPPAAAAGEGGIARINLRLPEQLKSQVEQSADGEGLSTNAWLVRAIAAAVDRGQPRPAHESRSARSGQRYTGWGR